MFIADTITYSNVNADKPILMVPASIADAVAQRLSSVGVACKLPGEARIDGSSPVCLLDIDVYSPLLQMTLEACLVESGFKFKRTPEQPESSPERVDWDYTSR